MKHTALSTVLPSLLVPALAVADEVAPPRAPDADTAARYTLPMQPAELARGPTGRLTVGWDGARDHALVEGTAAAPIHPRVTITALVQRRVDDRVAPGVGVEVVVVPPSGSSLAVSAGLRYRPEGFDEPEGEVEATLAVGVRTGAATLVANLAYGQDPEGNERDAELAVGAIRTVAEIWQVGATARVRDGLGTTAELGADRDGFATAFAGARFAGHAAVAVGAGVAIVDDGALHAGPAVSTSLAVAF